MPESAIAEAPAAPAAAPASPAVEIRSGSQPSPFGNPMSKPMEEAFAKLPKYSKGDDATKIEIARARGEEIPEPEKAIAPVKEEPPAKEEPKEQPKPERKKADEAYDDDEEEEKPAEEEKEDVKEVAKKEAEEPKVDRKKESPWKLLDKYKKSLLERETELAELKTRPSQVDPTISEKLTNYEKQIKQYEEELRFTNYQKHPEFLEKYQKPYEEAFDKAGKELRGLKINFVDPNSGETQARDLTLQDISVLASMEPAEARALIKDKFPQDAEEVKYHIKEIRRLAEARTKVLDDAKKGADQRMQQMVEAQKKAQEDSMRLWQQYNKEAVDKYDFLKPKDGDTERNERLIKAQSFVDKAWSQNAIDPSLTPEQRSEVIKSHAAVRNRAIAYTVLRHENKALKTRNAELEEALKQYKTSEPTNGGAKSNKASGNVDGAVTLDSIVAGMGGYAKGKQLGDGL